MCHKKAYPTWQAARNAVYGFRADHGYTLAVYHCTRCEYVHVGHTPPRLRRKMRPYRRRARVTRRATLKQEYCQ